jgi:hypothetical protein
MAIFGANAARQAKARRLCNRRASSHFENLSTHLTERRAPDLEVPVRPWVSQIGELIDAKIFSAGLAAHAVGLGLERYLLAVVEGAQTSTFDGADMNEDVLTAIVRLDEAEALCRVEPLNCSGCHYSLQGAPMRDELARPPCKRDPSSAMSWEWSRFRRGQQARATVRTLCT